MRHEFRAAALSLLIPCDVRLEQDLLGWIAAHLGKVGVAEEDHASWLWSELQRWDGQGAPSQQLDTLIKGAIYEAGRTPITFIFPRIDEGNEGEVKREACSRLRQNYFILLGRLRKMKLSHEEARLVLSYSGLIISFAIDYGMSASEISRMLGARDRRLALNWYPIHAITRACRCAPTFTLQQIKAAYGEGELEEPALLADLSVDGAIHYVGALAARIGCRSDLAIPLSALLLGTRHDPYLLILHFQLLILQGCDHAVTFAYEFSPRGETADWLVTRYQEAGLQVAGNPYLNNAKALLRFDQSWAWGRPDYLEQAHALVSILDEVETLGPLPKAELARYVRAVLQRIMRISWEEERGDLSQKIPVVDQAGITLIFSRLARANSGTTGILEQRLVDTVTSARHADWATRGRGDSVFAASTFRKKLGDIEFIKITAVDLRLIGYEAHGGHLTESYVLGHIASFRSILSMRREELENGGPLNEWSMEIVFVSHTRAADLLGAIRLDVDGTSIDVGIRYETFAELANEFQDSADKIPNFQRYFASTLNKFQVPNSVRQRVLEALEG